MNKIGLDNSYKQELELFVYFFANRTLAIKTEELYQEDYRKITLKHPELIWLIGELFLEALQQTHTADIKSKIVNFIHSYPEISESFKAKDLNPSAKNVYEVSRRFFYNLSKLSEENYASIHELFFSPNDFQLLLCVWGNNIKLDQNSNVTNEKEAFLRAKEFLQYFEDGSIPKVDFSEEELRHNT